MEIHELSGLELAGALRRREVSALEVFRATMERVSTAGFAVGAFAHVTEEFGERQARSADRRLAAGDPAPLLGVPVPIKDLTQVAGVPWEQGSAAFAGVMGERDDGVVRLLQEAGTVMPGKTSTAEFGFTAYTEPTAGPSARTPWDVSRTASGSSGGAAAAVAAGVVAVAHGSDGGGSLRIPAAACGVVGFKPSRGRISPGPLQGESVGLATPGVLTRTVRDQAALLDVLARPWPGDSWGLPPVDGGFLAACERGPGRLRVGVLVEPLACDEIDLHPGAQEAVARTGRVLEGLGHAVEEISRPMTGEDWRVFMVLWSAFAAAIPMTAEQERELSALGTYLRARGQRYGAADVVRAIEGMQALARKVAGAWEGVDVVLTPTLSGPPPAPSELQLPDPREDLRAQSRFTPWASTWNMLGAASISLPVHTATVDGVELPFGVMLSAVRPGADAMVLQLAAQVEAADPWAGRLPREVSGGRR